MLLRERGHTLKEIIVDYRWFGKTFQSAFGVYGYFTSAAPHAYYDFMKPLSVLFLLLMVCSAVFRGGVSDNVLLLLFLICSGGLIGASVYNSWVNDFQAQGRYLFSMIPPLCLVVYHIRRHLQDTLFRTFLMTMFLLSVYSFLFVGLVPLVTCS